MGAGAGACVINRGLRIPAPHLIAGPIPGLKGHPREAPGLGALHVPEACFWRRGAFASAGPCDGVDRCACVDRAQRLRIDARACADRSRGDQSHRGHCAAAQLLLWLWIRYQRAGSYTWKFGASVCAAAHNVGRPGSQSQRLRRTQSVHGEPFHHSCARGRREARDTAHRGRPTRGTSERQSGR